MAGCNPAAPAGTGTCTHVPVSSSQCTPTHLRHHSKHAHRRAESLRCSTARRPPRRVVGRPCGGHRITTALNESTALAPLRRHITDRTSPGHPTGGSLHVATLLDRMVSTRTTTSPMPPRHRVARLCSSHHDTTLPSHTVASHRHSVWPRVRTPVCLVTSGHHADADPPSSHSPHRSATLPWHPNLVQRCVATTRHTLFALIVYLQMCYVASSSSCTFITVI